MSRTPAPERTGAGPGDVSALCCSPLSEVAFSEEESARLAAVLSALSDPVRLRLLSIVAAEGEVCSCNLEAPLGKSQPTISHHTRLLAEAGLIVGERRGRWTWWRAVPERLSELRRALGGDQLRPPSGASPPQPS
ncbi:MAG TPA: metalloregulator ArsR/SmtB family transcription factor [Acidimicrobiales bacterium]|nr:metalloregulator ArsR/SmtB family transcription factor [Acidimicrobiales bacterium]